MATQSAIAALAKKIRLERKLNIAMRKILRDYSKELGRSLRVRGSLPNAAALTGRKTLVSIEDQYERTVKAFKKDFRNEIAKTHPLILENKTIEDDIDDNLASFIATQTVTRSSIITTTTQRDSEAAVLKATIQLLDDEIALTNEAVASRTTQIFNRSINSRASTIATTETQNAAEGSRLVEVETVIGNPDIEVEIVNKTWETIIDGVERESHFDADGQTVGSRDSFSVGFSSLLYPGDTSQGAGPEEIINCRCSTSYIAGGI